MTPGEVWILVVISAVIAAADTGTVDGVTVTIRV
jgi:hypothetical protein